MRMDNGTVFWNRPRAIGVGRIILSGEQVDCYLLNDGRALITDEGIGKALGVPHGEGTDCIIALAEKLPRDLCPPIGFSGTLFRLPNGAESDATFAEFLVELCELFIVANERGDITNEQDREIVRKARKLHAGLACIGIEALIAEATRRPTRRRFSTGAPNVQ